MFFIIKKIKKTLKHFIRSVVDEHKIIHTKMEIFSSKITVLACMTTFESSGYSSESDSSTSGSASSLCSEFWVKT